MDATYYAVRVGPDCFDLRQSRYAAQFEAGNEHPHDLMAVHFKAAELRDVVARYFRNDADLSALERDQIATPAPPRAPACDLTEQQVVTNHGAHAPSPWRK